MKILHIVAGDLNGGAARGAYWLHLGLKKLGVESQLYSNSKTVLGFEDVITTSITNKDKIVSLFRGNLDKFFLFFYSKRKKRLFSTGFFGFDLTKTQEYKDADILHLHWINNGFIKIKSLKKIKKPIVWTVRDMWPMTGGCHYSMNCENFKKGCGCCEQLSSKKKHDLSKIVLNRKKKYVPKHTKIVGVSNWVSNSAKESELFKNFDIRTIHNGINTTEFFPIDKKIAKTIFNITTKKKIILLGAQNLLDFHKGFGEFLKAVELLDREKYFLCFFGHVNLSQISNLGFEYCSFGYFHDNLSLRLAYSCADVFVAPSTMEAFGKTLVESMACGTPVACFDKTGASDLIEHKIDGYRAKPFDTKDLATGIKYLVNKKDEIGFSEKVRQKIVFKYDIKVIAVEYIKIYQEILNDFSNLRKSIVIKK